MKMDSSRQWLVDLYALGSRPVLLTDQPLKAETGWILFSMPIKESLEHRSWRRGSCKLRIFALLCAQTSSE